MNRLLGVFLSLCLLVSASGCSRSPEARKAKFFARAQKHIAKKELREARLDLMNAIRIDPNWGEAQFQLGKVCLEQKDYAKAFDAFAAAVKAQPERPDARVQFARLLLAGGRFDAAREQAQKALDLKPQDNDAQTLLAYAYAGLGKFEETEKDLEAVVTRDPAALQATLNLARLKLRAKDVAGAEAVLKEAAERAPSVDTLINLGNFQLLAKETADAEKSFRAATARDPRDTRPLYSLGRLLLVTKRAPEAEQVFTTIAQKNQSKPEDRSALARFHLAIGQRQKGLNELVDIVKRYPDDRYNRNYLASVYIRTGNWEQALTLINEVLQRDKTDRPARLIRAMMNVSRNRPADAIPDLRDIIRIQPDSADAHYYLGVALRMQNQSNEAMQELGEAIRRQPAHLQARIALAEMQIDKGWYKNALELMDQTPPAFRPAPAVRVTHAAALLKSGFVDAAGKELRELIAQAPKYAPAHRWMGMLLITEKRYDDARASFDKALQLSPRDAGSLEGLATAYVAANKAAEGEKRLAKVVADNPGYQPAVRLLAAVQISSGHLGDAQATLEKQVSETPSDLQSRVLLGDVHSKSGDPKGAEEQYRAVIQTGAKSAAVLSKLAFVVEAQKRPQEAIDLYRQALVQDPEDLIAANNLAALLVNTGGDMNEALKLAQIAKQKAPDNPKVADTLGWVYVKKGNYWLAENELRLALTAEPNNPVYLYHLGACHLLKPDKVAARQELTRALRGGGGFPGRERAEELLASLGNP